MYTGVYCPISDDKVISSVVVKGRIGIWRLMNGDLAEQPELDNFLLTDLTEQPELHNFFLTELHLGERNKVCYFHVYMHASYRWDNLP